MISIDLLIGRYPKLVGCRDSILDAAALLEETFRSGGTLYTCGNGGSATDADHIVGELAKGFLKRRPVPEELKNALAACEIVPAALGDDIGNRAALSLAIAAGEQ